MTIQSHLIDTILKVYTKHLETSPSHKKTRMRETSGSEDIVTISEEGRKRMFERLREEAIGRLKSGR